MHWLLNLILTPFRSQMNSLLSTTLFDSLSPFLGASLGAPELPGLGWLTNSILIGAVVCVAVIAFTTMATRRMKLIPDGKQNFVEFVIEFLYGQVEGVVGKHVAPKAFPLLATLFIYILVANWFGLVPGVGTIGWGPGSNLVLEKVDVELLRPATADLNMTFALGVVFMVVWAWLSIAELGVWGTIKHIFGPKGGVKGALALMLLPIFIFVGVIEVVSIMFRPGSLALRLFGNIYAGETLLLTMGSLGEQLGFPKVLQLISTVLLPLPFYFLEILVGALQATVFSLLCAVYIKLSTTHDDH